MTAAIESLEQPTVPDQPADTDRAQHEELLHAVAAALNVPDNALPRDDETRARLVSERAAHARATVEAALFPGANLPQLTKQLRGRVEALPVTYTVLCGRCREHPCGCCDCGWAPAEWCPDCDGCGCEGNQCRGGGHQ